MHDGIIIESGGIGVHRDILILVIQIHVQTQVTYMILHEMLRHYSIEGHHSHNILYLAYLHGIAAKSVQAAMEALHPNEWDRCPGSIRIFSAARNANEEP